MSDLKPDKLQVKFIGKAGPTGPSQPRRYTLTHSDTTGDLFLSIGDDYDQQAIAGWYTRLMRDEVLAELLPGEGGPELHVHCHVSGGIVFGPAKWRAAIFRRHLPQVLEAFRSGDRTLFEHNPTWANPLVIVHFHAKSKHLNVREAWGRLSDARFQPRGSATPDDPSRKETA
jgi:hypothetical protein